MCLIFRPKVLRARLMHVVHLGATCSGETDMEVISERWLGHPAGRAWIAFTLPGVVTSAGTFTALVECTVPSDCDAASNLFINDLHFTVTNATLAQLSVANDDGNFFAASLPLSELPEPATFALLGIGLAGIGFARPRRLN